MFPYRGSCALRKLTLAPWALGLLFSVGLEACQWEWDRYASPTPKGPKPGDLLLSFREECEGNTPDPVLWNTSFVAPDRKGSFHRYDWSGSWAAAENITMAEGICSLSVTNQSTGDARFGSATLDSTNKFEQKYGYFEVRAKAIKGKGLATIVSLGDATRWPPQVDFVHVSGGNPSVNELGGWLTPPGSDETQFVDGSITGEDLSADYHVFGIDWTPTNVVFYLDGVVKGALPQLAPALTTPMRIQLAPHAAITPGEQPDETTTFPARFEVDWVRVYKHARL